ncbi:hypothetical protein PPL_03665 [Heterostelium album PN500]|uniref:VASt domain-containing protein n=1 Tax=Heterostelium pallidum (strain ATCC 26659 / Pp 5 / PN500) TaxID=670386 RepID=D3B6B7_HETP5|nr:hypothetical protein PPL_03665 [Heterostelium album PN500]EFA82887.1 hypothetical protein PPL_03665 [Heterostelium album PN500]|eukprot:XP_020435004.1 hypothetical protein PPL_03665 [Heterostelium album PN500]
MKLLHLEEEFNISVETFFTFFFENPGFKLRYHTTRGDNTIDVKPWSPLPDGRYTREITFSSFISNNSLIKKLVGDKAKVREVQYYRFKDDSVLNVLSETFFEGSSIGKSFSSVSEWNVTPSSNMSPGCNVVIDVKNNYDGTMFKSALESWVHDTTEASFKHWLSLVRSQVEEYEQSEKLKRSAPPTPVKSQQQQQHQHQQLQQQQQGVVSKRSTTTTTTTTTTSSHMNGNHSSHNHSNHSHSNGINKSNGRHSNNRHSSSSVMESDDESIDDHSHNLDENHSRVRENDRNNNILQSLQQHQHQQQHQMEEDFEDDMSDLSGGPPSIHDDFTSDEEDNRSSSEDQFFDSSDVWQQNGGNNNDVRNYMPQLLPRHHQLTGGEVITAGNDMTGMNLSTYIAKLEELVKSQQEEELRSREKQREWESKVAELESRLRNVKNSSNATLWFNVMALLFFIVGWPIISRKLWNRTVFKSKTRLGIVIMKFFYTSLIVLLIVQISFGSDECQTFIEKVFDNSIDLYCTSMSLVGFENRFDNIVTAKGNLYYNKLVDGLSQKDKFLKKLSDESVACEPSLLVHQPFSVKTIQKISNFAILRNSSVLLDTENVPLLCNSDGSFSFKTSIGNYLISIKQTKGQCGETYFASHCGGNTADPTPIKKSEGLKVSAAMVEKWNETNNLYQYEGMILNDNTYPVGDVQISTKNFLPLSVWGLDLTKESILRMPLYKSILLPGEKFIFGFVLDDPHFKLDIYNYQDLS